MSSFNLTAQLNIVGPNNLRPVIANIRRQISSINPNINLNISTNAINSSSQLSGALQNLNRNLSSVATSANTATDAINRLSNAMRSVNVGDTARQVASVNAESTRLERQQARTAQAVQTSSDSMREFGKQSALAIRRFAAFTLVTGIIYKFTNALASASSEFMKFNKELVRVSQVTGTSLQGLSGLTQEITNLSTGLGVSSTELIGVSSTLAQAGLTAQQTSQALKALALSSLAPSFNNMNETVEGSIALMRQFSIETSQLEGVLGSINAVAAKFAVEADDIIVAIQRTGGVFAASSKGIAEGADALNQFIALFTSVRATTRESAETIATGLRTIFTRIQRSETIDLLKQFGIQLTDLEGKFVGPYEAIRRLSMGLSGLDTRDIRFSSIIEELGGFRQVGKVIPLLQQFSVAQQALSTAQKGQGSLTSDAAKAQQALAIQMAKVQEEFIALVRKIGSSNEFQTMVKIALDLSSALIQVADSAKHALPAIAAMLAIKGTIGAVRFAGGFASGMRGGRGGASGPGARLSGAPLGYARGGQVPVALEAGEMVFVGDTARKAGYGNLRRLNRAADRPSSTNTLNRASGGGVFMVPGSGRGDNFKTSLPEGSFVIKRSSVRAVGADNIAQMAAEGGQIRQKFLNGTNEPIKKKRGRRKQSDIDNDPTIAQLSLKGDVGLIAPPQNTKAGIVNASFMESAASFRKRIGKEKADRLIGDNTKSVLTSGKIKSSTIGDERNLFGEQGGILNKALNQLDKDISAELRASGLGDAKSKVSQDGNARRTISGFAFESFVSGLTQEAAKGEQEPFDFVLPSATKLGKYTKVDPLSKYLDAKPNSGANIRAEIIKKSLNYFGKYNASDIKLQKKAYGGLVQRFGRGSTRPLKAIDSMGRSELIKEAQKYKIPYSYDLLGLRQPNEEQLAIRQKFLQDLKDARIIEEQSRASQQSAASKKQFGVIGLRGTPKTSTEKTPNLKATKTKGAYKSKDITVSRATLPPYLSKRLEAIARKGYRETVAQMAALLGQRAGTGSITDKKQLNQIIRKTFTGGGLGQMFEASVAATGSPYPTGKSNVPMDLPRGVRSGVSNLFLDESGQPIKSTIPTDVTVDVDENKYAQMGRFLRDKREAKKRRQKAYGGIIQRFASGTSKPVERMVGYIDSDALNDPANKAIVEEQIEKLKKQGIDIKDGYRGYKRYLADLAGKARSSGQLSRMTSILGMAGAGKSTLMLGNEKSDNATLRKTSRFPILTPEDITRSSSVIDVSATLDPEQMGSMKASDRVVPLSTSTKAEQDILVGRRLDRDAKINAGTSKTGFGRKAGTTTSAPIDSGYMEAMLHSEIDPKKILTLGLTKSGFRRKKGLELPKVSEEKVNLFYGNMEGTRGHVAARDAGMAESRKRGVTRSIVAIGADTPIDPTDPHSFRTLLRSQKDRVEMGKRIFQGSDVISANKDQWGFGLPKLFDVGTTEQGQRHFVKPMAGSTATVGDEKDPKSLKKYTDAGLDPIVLPRIDGISGSDLRKAILSGDTKALKKLTTPEGFQYFTEKLDESGRTRMQAMQSRSEVLPKILERVSSKSGSILGAIEAELGQYPSRLTPKYKAANPDLIEKIEGLRKQKKKAESVIASKPGRMMRRMSRMFPSRYGMAEGGSVAPRYSWAEDKAFYDSANARVSRYNVFEHDPKGGSKVAFTGSFDDVFKFLHQKRQGPGSRKLASGGKAVSLPKPVASQSADKQQKQFGKIGLRSSGKEITAFYIKNNTREGFVTAHEIEKGVWNIGLSKATKGYGPRLYDAVMEAVTARGGVLTAHRGKVSGHAKKVWDVYANERNKPDSKYGSQVSKVPLDPKHHTISKDPTDSLNYGYQQQPNIIKGPDIVDMNDPKYDKFLQHMQFEFLRRARGGEIPIMAQEGEFVINKHAAGQIGHSNLRKLNRGGKLAAQTLEKLPKYHSGGSVQKLKVGGKVGTSFNDMSSPADLEQRRPSDKGRIARITKYEQKRQEAIQQIETSRAKEAKDLAAVAGDAKKQADITKTAKSDRANIRQALSDEKMRAQSDPNYLIPQKEQAVPPGLGRPATIKARMTAAEKRADMEARGKKTHKSLDAVTAEEVSSRTGDPMSSAASLPKARRQKVEDAARAAGFSTSVGTSGTTKVTDSDISAFQVSQRQKRQQSRTASSNIDTLPESPNRFVQQQQRQDRKTSTRKYEALDNSVFGALKMGFSGMAAGAAVGGTVAGIPGAVLGGAVGTLGGIAAGSIDEKSNRIRAAGYEKTASSLQQRASSMAEGGQSGSAIVASLNKAFSPVVSTAAKLSSGMAKLHHGAAALAGGLSKATSGTGSFFNTLKSNPTKAFSQAINSAIGGIARLAKGADSAVGSLMGMKKVDIGGGKQGWRTQGNGIMGRVGALFGMGGGDMGGDGVSRDASGRRKRGFGGKGRGGGGGMGMGGMMAEMAVSMAGSAIVDSMAKSAGGDKTKEGREIATVGGSAMSGAAMGMMMGSMLGPMGMAAGAALGGLAGYAYGQSQMPEIERQAASQKRMETIENARSKMGQDIAVMQNTNAPAATRQEAEARMMANFNTVAGAARAESVAGAKKKERTWAEWSAGVGPSAARTVEERVASAQPASDAAKDVLMAKMQKSGQSLEELEKSMPAAEFQKLMETIAMTDAGYQSNLEAANGDTEKVKGAARAAFERQTADQKAAGEALKAAQENAKLQQAIRKLTFSFEKSAQNMLNATAAAQSVLSNAAANIATIDNPTQSAMAGATAGSKERDILSNPDAYSVKEVEAAANKYSGLFGQDAAPMVQSAVLPRKLEASFGSAMTKARSTGKDGSKSDSEARAAVKNAVMQTAEASFGPDIANGMRERIQQFIDNFDGDIRTLDFNQLISQIPEFANQLAASGKSMEALKAMAELSATAMRMQAEAAQAVASKNQEIRNNQAQTFSDIANSTIAFKKAIGEKVSWQTGAGVRNQARAIRMGTSAETAASPQAMLQRWRSLDAQRQSAMQAQQDNQLGFQASQPGAGDQAAVDNTMNLARSTAELAQAQAQARQEIMNLPNDIKENMNGIMEELQDVLQERAAKIGAASGFMEKVLTSTPKDLRKMGDTFSNLSRTLSGRGVSFQESKSANVAYQQVRRQGGTHMQAQRAAQEAYAQESGDTLSMAKELAPLLGAVNPDAQAKMMGSVYESMFAARGIDTSKMQVGDKSMKDYIDMMKAGAGKDPKVQALEQALDGQQRALRDATDTINQLLRDESQSIITQTGQAVIDAINEARIRFDESQLEAIGAGITRPGQATPPGTMTPEQKANVNAQLERESRDAGIRANDQSLTADQRAEAEHELRTVTDAQRLMNNQQIIREKDETDKEYETRQFSARNHIDNMGVKGLAIPKPQVQTPPVRTQVEGSPTRRMTPQESVEKYGDPYGTDQVPNENYSPRPRVGTPSQPGQQPAPRIVGFANGRPALAGPGQPFAAAASGMQPGSAGMQMPANPANPQGIAAVAGQGQPVNAAAATNQVMVQNAGSPQPQVSQPQQPMTYQEIRYAKQQQFLNSRYNEQTRKKVVAAMERNGQLVQPSDRQKAAMAQQNQPQPVPGQVPGANQPAALPNQPPQSAPRTASTYTTPQTNAGQPVPAPRVVAQPTAQNPSGGVLPTGGFDAFASKLDTLLSKLAEVSIPSQITLTGSADVNIRLNGAEVLAQLPDSLRADILRQAGQQLANYDRGTTGEGSAQNSNIMGQT